MDSSGGSPVLLPGAIQWDRRSQATGRSHRIYAWVPPGPAPAEGYPLLVLTDAEQFFAGAVEQALTRSMLGDILPPLIVGVGHGDGDPSELHQRRIADFGSFAADRVSPFCGFLATELLPWITAQWSVDPARRGIFGFSLGALAGLQMLLHHPETFTRYVAASPALWWADRALIRAFAERTGRIDEAALLVTWGGDEDDPGRAVGAPGMTDDEAAGLVRMAKMIQNAQALVRILHQSETARVETWSFPGETHASVAWLSLARALGFALRR